MGMENTLELIAELLKEPENISSDANTIDSLCNDLCSTFAGRIGKGHWKELVRHELLQEFGIRYCKSLDPRFSYVCACLISMLQLRVDLGEVSRQSEKIKSLIGSQDFLPPDLLSVSQQSDILKLVQHTIALGILPNLIQGVGIPLKKRSEYAQELLDQAAESKVSDVEKYDRLSFTIRALLRVASHPTLGGLIYSKHLIDLLSALLQLCFAPIKEPDPASTSTLVTPALFARFMSERRDLKKQLDNVVDVAYQPTVIKSLLLLQGAPGNLDTVPRNGPLVIAPVWLRNACAQKLTSCLMRYNGILNVAEATLSDVVEGSREVGRLNAIGRLISTPPKDVEIGNYYGAISPQVITLLRTSDPKSQFVFLQLAFRLIQLMMEKSEKLTSEYILKPIFEPLLKCTECPDFEKFEIPDEYQTTKCVEDLHKCFVVNAEPGQSVAIYLKPILLVLFKLYRSVQYGASHLRTVLEELLLRALRNNSTNQNVEIFNMLAFDQCSDSIYKLKRSLNFVPGDEGGVAAVLEENEDNWLVSDDERAISVMDLMCKQRDSDALSQFFLLLLKKLGGMIRAPEEDSDSDGDDFESQLLRIEKQLDDKMAKLRESLMVIRLLGLLSESDNIQDVIMKDPLKVVEFTKSTLERAVILLQECPGIQPVENESICLAIAVLCSVASQNNGKNVNAIWDYLQTAVPSLDALIAHYPNEMVKECAEDLKLVLMSRGVYTNEMAKKMRREKRKLEKEEKKTVVKKMVEEIEKVGSEDAKKVLEMDKEAVQNGKEMKMLEEIGKVDSALEKHEGTAESGSEAIEKIKLECDFDFVKKEELKKKENYVEALRDIQDVEIPIKGHGLIALSRLIRSKDEEALKHKESLLQLLKDHLSHEDSYVYLAAIRGLVAMGDIFPDDVIIMISQEMASSTRCSEVRAKFYEALVGVLRILGDLTPKYKDQILNLLLNGVRDKSGDVRLSSLSALGEALRNLRFSVGGISQEVVSCLLQVLRSLDDLSIRACSVMCVTYLLQGLGTDALQVLQGSITELHRELRRLLAVETDDNIRLHTNLALDEVDKIMRNLLDPTQRPMEKEIFITRPPQ